MIYKETHHQAVLEQMLLVPKSEHPKKAFGDSFDEVLKTFFEIVEKIFFLL
jgi:hypothetical protein